MKKILCFMIVVVFVLAGCGTSGQESEKEEKSNEKSSSKTQATSKMKTFKIGQIVDADGVDVKVTKIEYVNDFDEYSAPENGKALKVHLKFKNNNEDQVLMDSTDFTMKVDNENYEQWFGTDDIHDGFSHQLNKGNTGSGYITYDVPDSEQYTLEMEASPKFDNVKAKWQIKKSDIKNEENSDSNQTNVSNEQSTNDDSVNEDVEESEEEASVEEESSDEITFTAEEYNDLVDEYNSLTDGEKMDHVNRDVIEIEYTQLEDRISALYDEQAEEDEKEYEEEMKQLEEEEKAEEERMEAEDKAFEEEMKREEAEYEAEMEKIDKELEEDLSEE
ncbi:DUF4352 domain-containing protein [Staphylococcus arlettae]|uniref:DUF4352 domain-containing protein n=2 Tax=Staphylococcus arlettae TaxID=29378 RepID=UPI000D1BA069|nr:DUF4352 domain-containing protein [Staphylococcus arlettae]PTH47011.1 RNA-binding protein [Staphylococcus arlettae]RIM71779.1 DUF4352 domain-containing protein [Staphylococcus arlettae]